jgi:hypothetical protein
MSHLVILLEEPSAKAMLEGLVPRIVPEATAVRFIVFEGKQDLEKQLTRKLRAYLVPEARFVVVMDQDMADCVAVKRRLSGLCTAAGHSDAVVRIACRELESWYLADFPALARAYDRPALLRSSEKARYRVPDSIVTPSKELKAIVPEYQKIDGSRKLGKELDPANARSTSFRHLVAAIRSLASEEIAI